MYTVSISNDLAQENMKKADKAKRRQRWDYDSSDRDSDDDEGLLATQTGTKSSSTTVIGLDTGIRTGNANTLSFNTAAIATGYDPSSLSHTESRRTNRRSLNSVRSTESRRQDLETVRETLQRGTTRGRRKVGTTMASPTINDPPSVPPISPNFSSNIHFSDVPHSQEFPTASAPQPHYVQQQQFAPGHQRYPQTQPPNSSGPQTQYPGQPGPFHP